MRKEIFSNDGYVHIYSRGVDRRSTFDTDDDRMRFLRGMIAFNSTEKHAIVLSRMRAKPPKSKSPLVRILCYALMPNHYHFLVQQLVDGGIAKFMQRLGRGYAAYFNHKYQRTGALWESEYKAVVIEDDSQLLHITRYIHLNPLKLFFPHWKIRGVTNWDATEAALLSYPWSSYAHYADVIQDPVVDAGIISTLFRGATDYRNFMKEWLMPSVQN